MKMLDLFCGRWGWSRAFAARGWECVGIDLEEAPYHTPKGCTFKQDDVLRLRSYHVKPFDFVCASSPCEEFSVHGLKCFFASPAYPSEGVKLFNHTRQILEESGVPYVMENVRAAQQFVGRAIHRCGPFYLWGTGVPPLMPQNIRKPMRAASGRYMREEMAKGKTAKEARNEWQREYTEKAGGRSHCASVAATIPPELANCVAEYAERLVDAARRRTEGAA